MQKSTSLECQPASEPLHISVNHSLVTWELFRFGKAANVRNLRVIRRGAHAMYKRGAGPNPPRKRRGWHPCRQTGTQSTASFALVVNTSNQSGVRLWMKFSFVDQVFVRGSDYEALRQPGRARLGMTLELLLGSTALDRADVSRNTSSGLSRAQTDACCLGHLPAAEEHISKFSQPFVRGSGARR